MLNDPSQGAPLPVQAHLARFARNQRRQLLTELPTYPTVGREGVTPSQSGCLMHSSERQAVDKLWPYPVCKVAVEEGWWSTGSVRQIFEKTCTSSVDQLRLQFVAHVAAGQGQQDVPAGQKPSFGRQVG